MTVTAVLGEYKNRVSNISENYFKHIRACGSRVLIPDFGDVSAAVRCDRLVICGGGDCDPVFYGQAPLSKAGVFDSEFDRFELETIRAFLKDGKPVLGICRGMQMINVACGGTLYQDIAALLGVEHPGEHPVTFCEGTELYGVFGKRTNVNSFHHQCVEIQGRGLRTAAVSDDGVIEAVEGVGTPVIGVQWHPERMSGNAVFEHFYGSCR